MDLHLKLCLRMTLGNGFLLVRSEHYCHWILLLLKFFYSYCWGFSILESFRYFLEFWFYICPLSIYIFFAEIWVWLFFINLLFATELFPGRREANPDLCSNFRRCFITIFFFFLLIMFYWIPFTFFPQYYMSHFHMWLFMYVRWINLRNMLSQRSRSQKLHISWFCELLNQRIIDTTCIKFVK